MQCRYCANEKADYRKQIPKLRKALKGVQAERLMFNYPQSFEKVAGPCITGLDSEGNVTGFTATQCVLYTHVNTGWRVLIHPCFEKDKTIFRAQGAATRPEDFEAFMDFFRLVTRDGETRGRTGALTLKQMAASFRKLDANASERQLANELGVTRRRIQQVLGDNGLTWDTFKQWALQGPITLTVPVEGSQVRRAAYYWERTDDGGLALKLGGEMKNIFIISHLAACAICGDYARTRGKLA